VGKGLGRGAHVATIWYNCSCDSAASDAVLEKAIVEWESRTPYNRGRDASDDQQPKFPRFVIRLQVIRWTGGSRAGWLKAEKRKGVFLSTRPT